MKQKNNNESSKALCSVEAWTWSGEPNRLASLQVPYSGPQVFKLITVFASLLNLSNSTNDLPIYYRKSG